MDLLKDIAEIVKNDKEHNVEVKINQYEVVIYLEYNPEYSDDRKCIIPIAYTSIEEVTYIPQDELVKIYNPTAFGIDLNEIKLIQRIMIYLESHKRELNTLCSMYSLDNRRDLDDEDWGQ